MRVGDWIFSIDQGQLCQVIEAESLWGETFYRVWLPGQDAVLRVRAEQLKPLDSQIAALNSHHMTYIAAAARVADAINHDVLLAPMESSIIPLPHQIRALSRAISNDHVRYLLADEVGLGKTIEAGLIMRELKLRGLVKRTLVVAPKGLVTQWQSEMRVRFDEEFHPVLPEDLKLLKRITPVDNSQSGSGVRSSSMDSKSFSNPLQIYRQIIVPVDSFKPLDKRQRWKKEDVAAYNRERFENLVTAGWDLIIVDEAHRLAGSTEQVARHKLGRGLGEAAPYLLLLTATPHQGKTDAFHRLISLLDTRAFADPEGICRERVEPYVIRSEKRRAIDVEGKPLFMPRHTQMVPIAWGEEYRDQRLLYDAVTEYVREHYNLAIKEKKTYLGFLMILMQRLVTSSTRAIRTSLDRRLSVLQLPEEQLSLFPAYSEDEWQDLDGQEQVEALLQSRFRAMKDERQEVKLLLEVARRTEEAGPDVKAAALLEWIYRLQQEEGDPKLKVLVFTEFVPTQEMLHNFLVSRGFYVVCLNGSMSMEERMRVQDAFSKEAQILISTDAGGEGLNLQFCHVVVNYDIPWNPMRLEQRIGRVDRIGQEHKVSAINFVLEDTVEYRVREVLEEKLSVILRDFGVDKAGDVLDSAQAGEIFDDLYMEAILRPEALEKKIEDVVSRIHQQAQQNRENISLLGQSGDLDPDETKKLMAHPLPYWMERMTTSYLKANGGKAERKGKAWHLSWPDGDEMGEVTFTMRDAVLSPSATHLTLEDPRLRNLVTKIARFAPGQPVPEIRLPGLAQDLRGVWSLWQIALHGQNSRMRRILPLFVHEDGRVLGPTARFIWDQLLLEEPQLSGHMWSNESMRYLEKTREAAEAQGRPIYEELLQAHQKAIAREMEKAEYAFIVRKRSLERIGLAAVKRHRLMQLEREKEAREKELEQRSRVLPEMVLLIMIHVISA
jgi:superfamily II DNA/RNA helicase